MQFLINIYFFTSLLLLYFSKVKKFKVILKAKSAMRKLVRMGLAQSGYGSGLLPLVYYHQNIQLIQLTLTSTIVKRQMYNMHERKKMMVII